MPPLSKQGMLDPYTRACWHAPPPRVGVSPTRFVHAAALAGVRHQRRPARVGLQRLHVPHHDQGGPAGWRGGVVAATKEGTGRSASSSSSSAAAAPVANLPRLHASLQLAPAAAAATASHSAHLARVRPTLMRRSSATKPMPRVPRCERTVEKNATSFSRPCRENTCKVNMWVGGARGGGTAGGQRQLSAVSVVPAVRCHVSSLAWKPSMVLMSTSLAASSPRAALNSRRSSDTCTGARGQGGRMSVAGEALL